MVFAAGASLFMLGSLLSLVPADLSGFQINCVFFAGSIPFTVAGYLQHFQLANTSAFAGVGVPTEVTRGIRWIGWQPANPGWWCTLTQFAGWIAFKPIRYIYRFLPIISCDRAPQALTTIAVM